RADRHRDSAGLVGTEVLVVPGPLPGAGRGTVGDRDVLGGGGPVRGVGQPAVAGDEHGAPVRADGQRRGPVLAVHGAVVAADPQPGAGRGAVSDRGPVLV